MKTEPPIIKINDLKIDHSMKSINGKHYYFFTVTGDMIAKFWTLQSNISKARKKAKQIISGYCERTVKRPKYNNHGISQWEN